ncbi:MAG: hypothetical protein AB7V50_11155 [Vampirovibrionia bacterium]
MLVFNTKQAFYDKKIKQVSMKELNAIWQNKSDSIFFGNAKVASTVVKDVVEKLDPNKLKYFERLGYKISQKVPDSFYEGSVFKYISKLASERPSVFEALAALLVTCTVRPVAIMALPGAEVEDKKYAAVKSIASGLVGYAISCVVFTPIGKFMENLEKGKYTEMLKKAGNREFPLKPSTPAFSAMSYVVNYGSKYLFAIPIAVATFKMIPWMMKKLFPDRKKKPLDSYNPPISATKMNQVQSDVFDPFVQFQKRGVK